jgi:hypothetical protein
MLPNEVLNQAKNIIGDAKREYSYNTYSQSGIGSASSSNSLNEQDPSKYACFAIDL